MKPYYVPGSRTDVPDTQIAIIDGRPELVLNTAMVRELLKDCPVGPVEGRRRLIEAGFPVELLDGAE